MRPGPAEGSGPAPHAAVTTPMTTPIATLANAASLPVQALAPQSGAGAPARPTAARPRPDRPARGFIAARAGAQPRWLSIIERESRLAPRMTRPARPMSAAVAAGRAASPAAPSPAALADGGADRHARDVRLAALLAAAATGDASAFEAFYEATFAYARTVARRLLRSHADIEDLLADCYFEAWRTASRFDAARGSPVTWLLTLVRSRGLDALRAAAARPDRAGLAEHGKLDDHADAVEGRPEPLEASADAADDPAQRLWRREASAELTAALSTLTAPERWVLGLAYLRELSHAEIAYCTGMPLGTVKSHVRRAQNKLRARLDLTATQVECAAHVPGTPR